MNALCRLVGIFIGVAASAVAADEPQADFQLVRLLSDQSKLSPADAIAMQHYIRAIRDWIASKRSLSPETSYIEARAIVDGRTAEDVARMGEIAHRLSANERLSRALETDSLAAQRLLDSALAKLLSDADFAEVELGDRLIRLIASERTTPDLPRLGFRQKK